jgi:hypothetical protein
MSFILFLILKTRYVLKCEEIPLNYSRITYYSIYNIFIGIPKAKAFIINYFIFFEIFERKKNNSALIVSLFLGLVALLIILIKFSILMIVGYSYLSLLTASILSNMFFELLT